MKCSTLINQYPIYAWEALSFIQQGADDFMIPIILRNYWLSLGLCYKCQLQRFKYTIIYMHVNVETWLYASKYLIFLNN